MTSSHRLPPVPPEDDPRDASGEASAESRLAAYLDDAMSPDEAREFLAWLEAHPDALRDAEEHRRVWALLGAYPDEPVPAGFARRAIARAEASATSGGTPDRTSGGVLRLADARRWRYAAAAAAVLAAIGIGFAVPWNRGTEVRPESATSLAALDALPDSLLDDDAIDRLASLSDEEFEALLVADPQDLAPDASRTTDRGG